MNDEQPNEPLKENTIPIVKKSYKELFLEKWNRQDEYCPTCNHITKIERGITKQNMKRLVWGPPNVQDWLTLIMIIGVLMMAYMYQTETATCRDTIANIDETCTKYCSINKISYENYVNQTNQDPFSNLNISLIVSDNSSCEGSSCKI